MMLRNTKFQSQQLSCPSWFLMMACRPTSPLDQSPGMEKWSQMQVLTQVDAQLAIWNCMDDPSVLKR